MCDFGFARIIGFGSEPCTEYVATRWYRAPELLVGEQNYGGAVDVWAIGCLFAEMMTGEPIFPGESDIDQLFLIIKMFGEAFCVVFIIFLFNFNYFRKNYLIFFSSYV